MLQIRTHMLCNTYCSSATTMVVRTRLKCYVTRTWTVSLQLGTVCVPCEISTEAEETAKHRLYLWISLRINTDSSKRSWSSALMLFQPLKMTITPPAQRVTSYNVFTICHCSTLYRPHYAVTCYLYRAG